MKTYRVTFDWITVDDTEVTAKLFKEQWEQTEASEIGDVAEIISIEENDDPIRKR